MSRERQGTKEGKIKMDKLEENSNRNSNHVVLPHSGLSGAGEWGTWFKPWLYYYLVIGLKGKLFHFFMTQAFICKMKMTILKELL